MMRILMLVLFGSIMPAAAFAQASPAAVGASVSSPTQPTGKTPPGTPDAATANGSIARDSVGQQVIGHTATPPGNIPGNTGGAGTGAK